MKRSNFKWEGEILKWMRVKNNVDNAKKKSLLIKFHFFWSGRVVRHFLKSDDVEDDIDRIP